MKRYFLLAVLVLFILCGNSIAASIKFKDIQNSTIETFDDIVGISVPVGGFAFGIWGQPSAGFVLPSGLKLVLPDPNTRSDFVIGDFRFDTGPAAYGLGDNGTIQSAAYLRNGTSIGVGFGTSGGIRPKAFAFTFEFPNLVRKFGIIASSGLRGTANGELSLTSIGIDGAPIETLSFQTLPVPFTEANFAGLVAEKPIKAFTVSSNNFFAFDEVVWEVVPEPSCSILLSISVIALTAIRYYRLACHVPSP